jgi:hypothetical protein
MDTRSGRTNDSFVLTQFAFNYFLLIIFFLYFTTVIGVAVCVV